MAAPAASEDEFIELFRTLKSPQRVAEMLRVSVRSVHSRRRNIEIKRGIKLDATDSKARQFDHLQVSHQHPRRMDLGILNGSVIVFSDAHFWPGIRTTAFRGLLTLIENIKPWAVVNNGDAFDGASISRHPRIGWDNAPTVLDELKACDAALGEIEEVAKQARHNVRLIWALGNHCARAESRLAAVAPQFQGVKGFALKDHFPSWEPCWAVWNNDTVIKHRYKGGIHATHNNTVSAGINIVTGHLHSLKVTPFNDYRGIRYGVDTGTLAEPTGPQFRDYLEESPTNWRSGFVVLSWKDGRLLWPEVVHVWDADHVEFRGHIIRVAE